MPDGAEGGRSENPLQVQLFESINAITLCTNDMRRSCEFFEKLGLVPSYGGPDSSFSTYAPSADSSASHSVYVNLIEDREYEQRQWGRVVFHVSDVDAMHQRAVDADLQAEFAPRDAPWGERYFHILDPMGHELSFAKRIEGHPRWRIDESS